ncbi:hypothetical protein HQ533_00820 [Candidatus Woesearchaeota archaeon]|nr:hypothetical protein [Candidatus Woesearchaeota archaeon]
MAKKTKHKPKFSFADQRIQETLEDIVGEVGLLEGMLTNMNKFERENDMEKVKKIFEAYLSEEDYEYMRDQQNLIKKAKKVRHTGTKELTNKIQLETCQHILQKALPEERIIGYVNDMTRIMTKVEDDLIRFAEHVLIPALFVDKKGNQLEYIIEHRADFLCKPCDKVTTYKTEVNEPIKDKQYFRLFREDNVPKKCDQRRCKDPQDTELISTGNWYKIKAKDSENNKQTSEYATKIRIRLKGGERLIDKLVDKLRGVEEGESYKMKDVAGLRIVGVTEQRATGILQRLHALAKEFGVPIENVEFKDFPRKRHKANITDSGIHLKFVYPERALGQCNYQSFEIQVADQLAENWYENHKDINHLEFRKKQANKQRDNWSKVHYALTEHLKPIFARRNYFY